MHGIFRSLTAGLFITLLAAPVSRAESPLTFEEVLQGIDRYYAGFSSFKASFTQLVEVPALEKSERFNGTLYFLKPEYLRLEYRKPRGQLLVADGTWYWFYMPQEDVPQAMRAPMGEGVEGPRYVLGGQMSRRFSGTMVGREPRGGAESYVLDLEPLAPTNFYKTLRAWVDSRTFATRAVRYLDESGNFNTFDLSDFEQNAEFSSGKFNFTPPPGTQILDEN
ncbi:MAG: hypothetical protein A3F83_12750 [Candidatus Glassbacteria bacterium RIFCSPLOWO2_12_FULL_58_11]|uniref:Outer-membrane lipoprotein carrier protein n=1 Tax=Candidatus Glassbacteria bacterium RIFCSPLOWO2_12_FULL_58_11 TaxID=1817867 RepID=A0A1F5YLU6_9BACT|nr:MAG: hypothetical protein A3F83_12750 [Candidatus Glassbacteria bacterium RIFCSPLOWO2_12_FULL_58_11]